MCFFYIILIIALIAIFVFACELMSETVFSSYWLLLPILVSLFFIYKANSKSNDEEKYSLVTQIFFAVVVGSFISAIICLPNRLSLGNEYRAKAVISSQYIIPGRSSGASLCTRLRLENGVITISDKEIYHNYSKGDSVIVLLKDGLFGLPVLASYETQPLCVASRETTPEEVESQAAVLSDDTVALAPTTVSEASAVSQTDSLKIVIEPVKSFPDSIYNKAVVAVKKGFYSEAWDYFNASWQNEKNPDALLQMGIMYEKGRHVGKDINKAYALYRRADSLGSHKAKKELNRLLGL